MDSATEVRFAGVVVGRAAHVRDRDAGGAFVVFAEPLPVGTAVVLKGHWSDAADEVEQAARVTEVVESADPNLAGMRVKFVAAAEIAPRARAAPAPVMVAAPAPVVEAAPGPAPVMAPAPVVESAPVPTPVIEAATGTDEHPAADASESGPAEGSGAAVASNGAEGDHGAHGGSGKRRRRRK